MRKINVTSLSIILIASVFIWHSFNEVMWNKSGVMVWDVACYYGYLTKAFNHNTDLPSDELKQFPTLYPPNKYVTTSDSVNVLKTTMGMSAMYLPFYAIGHFSHYMHTGNAGTGLEIEYRMSMQFAEPFI